MSEIYLEIDSRQWRRQFERAIGRSPPKILTELITNADDSYRRIEEEQQKMGVISTASEPAPITIEFHRGKKSFAVVDNAQGLTDDEMKRRFGTYGKDSGDDAAGFKTRSLFGKGLRDVLFTQHHGRVKSIKDGIFYDCKFRWKDHGGHDKPTIDPKPGIRADKELRRELSIPKNGTRVEFQLAESVHNPQAQKLYEDLCNFYMLRILNANPKRKIVLKTIPAKGKVTEQQLAYEFPRIEVKKKVDTTYAVDDDTTIHISGDIGLTESEPKQGEVSLAEREGGVLLIDETDSVLDLTLFGYDRDENARRISGLLRLDGAGAYIRKKLNQSRPEEILTESRDGFTPSHEFTIGLHNLLRPYLAPIVEEMRKQNAGIKVTLSTETQKRHRSALDLLNRLAKELLGPTGREPILDGPDRIPPDMGIAFLQTEITAKVGIETPVALLINSAMVRSADTIMVASDQQGIAVTPNEVTIAGKGADKNPVVRLVRITASQADINGILIAKWRDTVVTAKIRTTARDVITPFDGIEFEKPEYSVRTGGTRVIRLFVDTTKVPLRSEITFSSASSSVTFGRDTVTIEYKDIVVHNIACCELKITGAKKEGKGTITATHLQHATSTNVDVKEKETQDRGKQGLFKDYKFEELDTPAQTMINEDTGYIIINVAEPVNERYFTRHPTKEIIQDQKHCSVRLADLILNECLQHMVARAYQQAKLPVRFNNPFDDIRRYMDEERSKIGLQFHNLFVSK